MRKIILIAVFVCIGFSIPVYQVVNAIEDKAVSARSEGFDGPLRNICNRVMIEVYNDILSVKEDHDNLVNFGEHVLSKNQYGIYNIDYKREIFEGARKGEYLKFGVTIVKPEDANFGEFGPRAFNYSFPLLDLKFTGYQKTNRKFMKFDIRDIVQRNGDRLLEEQIKQLPLKLSLKTDREYYKIREKIEVTVTLENITRSNLWVKSLDNDTLYFLYDGAKWGTVAVGKKKRKKMILKPGQKIHKKFVGSGSYRPREIEIYGSYNMTFKGVKPSSILKVKIVE